MATKYTKCWDTVSYNKSTWTYNVNGNIYSSASAAANALANGVGRGTFSSASSAASSSGGSSGGSSSSSRNSFVDPSVLHDAEVNGLSQAQIDAKWWTGTSCNLQQYYSTYWWGGYSSSSGTTATKAATTKAATTTSTGTSGQWWDKWPWNYAYNNKSWYYEKVDDKGLTYQEDSDYYGTLYDKDKFNPDTTYERGSDADWLKTALNDTTQYGQGVDNANIDLTGGEKNANMNTFGAAVNSKLQTAFGIQNMAQLKEMYPEQYSSLVQSLNAVAGTWNALDPSQRQLLDWQLQAIIWTAVGAGSDTSKLNVLNESMMNKFEDGEKVAQDMKDIINLQTKWLSTEQIADKMWISEDQVQQAVLAYNWLDNRLWEYYKLKEWEANEITEDYDTKMERLEKEKEIALERANRSLEWLKEDFDKNYERQKKANEVNEHNADFLAGQFWFGFSKRGMEWLDYVTEQAKQIIDDMVTNYDRSKIEIADWVADIIRNWEWNNEDLLKASEDALTAAKNNYTSNMLKIQQQYGTVWMQAQQQLANNVQAFITQAENIYDNALNRQQQNLSNLITNFSNLNALQYSNLTLRNAQIQQFQQESMNMNRNQLQWLAQQLWMDQSSFQDLVNYQMQAVANELNWYIPWAWAQLQGTIQSLLNQWYTPNQALQSIMNSDEFKNLQSTIGTTSNTWKSAGNGFLYDNYWNTKQIEWYNSSTTSNAKAKTTDANGNYQRVDLKETPNEDTWIKNVYGSTVKLSPTVWAMFTEAYNNLAAQWIELKVWDSYRSYETQKNAYEAWKAWVVSPDKSYHVKGQAFDVVQDGSMYDERVVQALLDAGFTRPNAKEPRHWSYWEWKDARGGKPRNNDAYDMARAILNGTADKPSKNTTSYTDVSLALNDLVNQKRPTAPTSWPELIQYSVLKEKDLDANTAQSITSTFVWLSNTERLMELLEENGFQTWPIMSHIAKLNPRNKWMAEIQAQINTMAAGIARWFGEKWVLSDKDIERYMKTLPNEKLWGRAQQAVWDLLKISLYKALVNSLENAAKQWKDVHMYIDDYNNAVSYLQSMWIMDWWGRWLTWDIDLSNYGRS